jgi:putative hemolysin
VSILFWIIICLVFSFFFSGIETGVLSLNRVRIRHLKEQGSFNASILLDFLHRPGHLSSTVLVGNTLVDGVATVLVAETFLEYGSPIQAVAGTLLFTIILMIIGHLIPKSLFQRFPNRLTTRLAPVLLVSYIVLWPFVQLFHLISQTLIQLLGGKISPRQMFATREELKFMAKEVGKGGTLTGEQTNLLSSILDSQNATVRDIMRSKSQVVSVKDGHSPAERKMIALSSHYSRLPVESRASERQIKWEGLWVVYDCLFCGEAPLHKPIYLEARTNLEDALLILRKSRSQFAIVKDEMDKDIGIVTVQDILQRYLGKLEL